MEKYNNKRFVLDQTETTLHSQCCGINNCQEQAKFWCGLSKLKLCQKHNEEYHTKRSEKIHKVVDYNYQDFDYCPTHLRKYTQQDIQDSDMICNECLLYDNKYHKSKLTFYSIQQSSENYAIKANTYLRKCNSEIEVYGNTQSELQKRKIDCEKNKKHEIEKLSQNQIEMIQSINEIFTDFCKEIEEKALDKKKRIEDKIKKENEQIQELEDYKELGDRIQEAYELKVNTYVIEKSKKMNNVNKLLRKNLKKLDVSPSYRSKIVLDELKSVGNSLQFQTKITEKEKKKGKKKFQIMSEIEKNKEKEKTKQIKIEMKKKKLKRERAKEKEKEKEKEKKKEKIEKKKNFSKPLIFIDGESVTNKNIKKVKNTQLSFVLHTNSLLQSTNIDNPNNIFLDIETPNSEQALTIDDWRYSISCNSIRFESSRIKLQNNGEHKITQFSFNNEIFTFENFKFIYFKN
ncbi:hypothetical protein M0813_09858 [Anaeramoeba flamelloides]|uniref:B box-type domain-containing protein n=1 Tax=Anaeramoeba flamelloides TaxID=1746091 RepID=A0ABQ8X3Q5_9EUKA|nr:hypothetical protein M0813_09858 [Anaeramoeba flamelloides]